MTSDTTNEVTLGTEPKYGWICTRCNNSVHPDEKICPVCTTTYLPLPVPQYPYYIPTYPPYNPFPVVITC